MDQRHDLAIIGGGIIGLATAYQLLQRRAGLGIVVLEKERELAAHQSGHNSGVLHAGMYYSAGSLKARLCREGKAEMERFADDHAIPYRRCGKLVVAVRPEELDRLASLKKRAEANGVEGLQERGPEGIREIEPHARGIRALYSPGTGITDFRRVALAMADRVRDGGGTILTGARVDAIRPDELGFSLKTARGIVRTRLAISCAGLHSDRVARMTGGGVAPRIVPFRGSYLTLKPEARNLVSGLIYPVPDPRLPFLGVHFTARIDGQVWVGPNAVLAFAREGYSPRRFSGRDLAEMFGYPGFWRLARRHWREGWVEFRRALARRLLVRELQRYVPEVRAVDLAPGPSGVRAQAVDPAGGLVDDFEFEEGPGILHVRNAPSPGATASLAIGRYIAERAAARFGLR